MSSTNRGESAVPAVPSGARRWLQWYDANVPPKLSYPHIPIFQILEDTAAKYPESTSAIFFGKRFTYGQIKELSDSFAAGVQRLGIQSGDRVALLPNSPRYIIAYYGLLKTGARNVRGLISSYEFSEIVLSLICMSREAIHPCTAEIASLKSSKLRERNSSLPFAAATSRRFWSGASSAASG